MIYFEPVERIPVALSTVDCTPQIKFDSRGRCYMTLAAVALFKNIPLKLRSQRIVKNGRTFIIIDVSPQYGYETEDRYKIIRFRTGLKDLPTDRWLPLHKHPTKNVVWAELPMSATPLDTD